MKRLAWPIIAIVAVFALGVITTLSLANHAEQRAVIRAQAQTSAATSITVFLLAVILSIVLLAVILAIGLAWWQRYQKRAKVQDALYQAQVYALLQGGAGLPAGERSARPLIPAPAGGNVLVFPGGQQAPVVSEQPDVLPAGWEVVE